MNFKYVTKKHLILLLINIAFVLFFLFFYLVKQNYEFVIYVGVIIFFMILITYLHLKFNFSMGVLIGLSIWGLLHMLGGYIFIEGVRLYGNYFFGIRYDKFVHIWGFGFATLFAYYILRPSLIEKIKNKMSLLVLLIFIGMGIGALNELIEFFIVLIVPQTGIGGYNNSMGDLVANTIGAIIAVVYINIVLLRKKKNARKQSKRK